MKLKEVLVLFSIVILLVPFVSSISDVHHSVDGNNVTITYEGNPPFWINIRKDENIGQDEGYAWAKTNSKTFTIGLGFAINPSKKFYYAVKDTEWSRVQSFVLGDEADKCSDGTLFGECSSTKPYYCDNSDMTYGGNGTLIKNCQKCGCPEQEECQEDGSCKEHIATENKKDLSLYSNKEAFLISDKDWKDVLPLVPVTTWTGSEEECQRGTGTPDNVCIYPTLIYHEEEFDNSMDIDEKEFREHTWLPLSWNFKDNTLAEGDVESESDDFTIYFDISGDKYEKMKKGVPRGDLELIVYNPNEEQDKPPEGVYIGYPYYDIFFNGINLTDYRGNIRESIMWDGEKYWIRGAFWGNEKNLLINGINNLTFKKIEENDFKINSYKLYTPYFEGFSVTGNCVYAPDELYGLCIPEVILNEDSIKVDESLTYTISIKNIGNIYVDFSGEDYTLGGSWADPASLGKLYRVPYWQFLSQVGKASLPKVKLQPGESMQVGITVIFNKSESIPLQGFDADSIIYFMQQYSPDKLTVIGDTPQELANLLVAEPELGAGLLLEQIGSITSKDYLSYWKSYKDVVYVEDDYELALLASTYASLINAPLIIQGTGLDLETSFSNKNIICIGNADPMGIDCNEQYNLEQLQQKYVGKTSTDKLMIVNPDDINTDVRELFEPEKLSSTIMKLYSKTSMAAPILAGAKHELITSVSGDYKDINSQINQKIDEYMPNIINNPSGLKTNNFENPTRKIYKKNMNTLKEEEVVNTESYSTLKASDEHLIFTSNGFYDYNIRTGEITKLDLDSENMIFDYEVSGSNMIYLEFCQDYTKSNLGLYDLNTGHKTHITKINDYINSIGIDSNHIIWTEKEEEGICQTSGESCSLDEDCKDKYCYDGRPCENRDDCDGGWCGNNWCIKKTELHHYDISNGNEDIIAVEDYINRIDISNNKVIWRFSNGLKIYDIDTATEDIIDNSLIDTFKISNDKIIWTETNYFNYYYTSKLYLYDINTKDKIMISDNVTQRYELNPQINNNKVLWIEKDAGEKYCWGRPYLSCNEDTECRYCLYSKNQCNEDEDCGDGDYCMYDTCISTVVGIYDIETGDKNILMSGKIIEWPVLTQDNLFWIGREMNEYYISGFLTIFGPPSAIPEKEFMWLHSSSWAPYHISRSLDSSEYADVYLDDNLPDISVGRIQGITLSDVSSYLARDLFLDKIEKTNNMEFLASSFNYMMKNSNNWNSKFADAGYNSHCSILNPDINGEEYPFCDNDMLSYQDIWPELWKNKDMIIYMDHGGSN